MIPSCRRTHLCRTQRLAPAIINRSFQRGRTEQAPTKYELVINLKTAKAARFCAGNAARNRQRGDARACWRTKTWLCAKGYFRGDSGRSVMANKDIIIGRV